VMLRPALVDNVNTDLVAAAQFPVPPGFLNVEEEEADNAGDRVKDAMSSDYFTAIYDADGSLRAATWQDRPEEVLPNVSRTFELSDAVKQTGVFQVSSIDGKTTYHAVVVPYQWDHQGSIGVVLVAISMRETETIIATYLTIFFGLGLGVIIIGALLT